MPDSVWSPLVAGVLLFIVGLIGLAAGRPLLFPSLGPSAFQHTEMPGQHPSRFYNTLVAHLVALGAGFLAVAIVDAWDTPPVLSSHILTMTRVGAATLGVVITLAVVTLLHASHPPAAATTLLVALGSFKTADDALTVIIGVLILAILGEIARQVRVRATQNPNPVAS